ncbi:MAG: NTP transferase domain-containing protein [Chthoniobacterales bacterium]|nr:NTP transferase domain-containing protein [Chthoniobacterales bacterium]
MTLVLLAAGLGSRYGGLKQLTPVGPKGEVLLDYSVRDAVKAGFSEIVFIIRREIEELFQQKILSRYQTLFPGLIIRYVFQELTDLVPPHFSITRTKPWGTGHALLAARHVVTTPFAVINADDYYGPTGFVLLKKFFENFRKGVSTSQFADAVANCGTDPFSEYAMVAYELGKTLSEHGSVSRGICETSKGVSTSQFADTVANCGTDPFFLTTITERTAIERTSHGIVAQEKEGQLIPLKEETWVSLNFWGFTPAFFAQLEEKFSQFLEKEKNLTTTEFYLPQAINDLIQEKRASVQLFPTPDRWMGLTYPEDLAVVQEALRNQ